MTFVLNNNIVCVGKWSVEKQNTRTNQRLHCAKDECILYTIVSSTGEYKKTCNIEYRSIRTNQLSYQ